MQKRFRIFAGPNGSGKSTIINSARNNIINNRKIDFGVYVNADDIVVQLTNGAFTFDKYNLPGIDNDLLRNFVFNSGLIRGAFTQQVFDTIYELKNNRIVLYDIKYKELMAQALSNFMVEQLILLGKKCTMETVFSHKSKVDVMRLAAEAGYKVYLYFVATEDPEINKARVKIRVQKQGHDVPEHAIEDRYYRSLALLCDGVEQTYHSYFFDNSGTQAQQRLVAFCKNESGQRVWNDYDRANVPGWFTEHCLKKCAG